MKNTKTAFMVSVKVGDEVFFSVEKDLQGVAEWQLAYENTPDAEEIKVYEQNSDGLSYSLMYKDYNRRIGFQKGVFKKWLNRTFIVPSMRGIAPILMPIVSV